MSEGNEQKKEHRGPVETLRDGALKLAIFRNEGENGPYYSMATGRVFTDGKTGQIRETSTFQGSEALRMGQLLVKGYERVLALRGQDRYARMNPQRGIEERER